MCQTLGVFSWVRDHFHDEKSTFSNLTNPDFDVFRRGGNFPHVKIKKLLVPDIQWMCGMPNCRCWSVGIQAWPRGSCRCESVSIPWPRGSLALVLWLRCKLPTPAAWADHQVWSVVSQTS